MANASALLAASRYGQRRRRGPTPEGSLLRTVLEGLAARRIFARRLNSGVAVVESGADGRPRRILRAGFPGCPDIVALLGTGRTLWIECKAARGKLSKDQIAFQNACLRTGNLHVVARSFSDVEPFLGTGR